MAARRLPQTRCDRCTRRARVICTQSQSLLKLLCSGSVFGFAAGDRGPEARRLGVPEAPYPSPASAPTTASTAGLDATGPVAPLRHQQLGSRLRGAREARKDAHTLRPSSPFASGSPSASSSRTARPRSPRRARPWPFRPWPCARRRATSRRASGRPCC